MVTSQFFDVLEIGHARVPASKNPGLLEKTFQAGQRTRRSIKRRQECLPLSGIQTKVTPIRQRFIGTGECTLQNKLAYGTIGGRRRS